MAEGEPAAAGGGRGDGTGAAEPRERAAEAVFEAWRLLGSPRAPGTWPAEEDLGPAIGRLAAVERELVESGEDFSAVFVCLGLLLGARCMSRRESPSPDPGERAEALRRLRWTDRNGSLADTVALQARMVLLVLLAPWALPRPDGTRTALLDALLAAADGRALTRTLRRDLTEAREVAGRIAEAPVDQTPFDREFHRQAARIKQDIERMLAAGSPPSEAGPSSGAGTPSGSGSPSGAGTSFEASGTEDGLLPAVRGLLDLAGSYSTPRFTRVLAHLVVALRSGFDDGSFAVLGLDPEVVPLLSRAAARGAADADGVRRAAGLALGALRALPPDAPERVRVARLHAYLLVALDSLAPGAADFSAVERPAPETDGDGDGGGGDRLTEWPVGATVEPGLIPHLDSRLRDFVAHLGLRERRMAARFDRLLAYRTGDPGYLEDAAALLGEAVRASPAGSWWALALGADLAEVLEHAAVFGGSFHDAEASLATLRGLRAALESDGSVPPDAPFALGLVLSTADLELYRAQRTGDHRALPRLREELRGRYAALPPHSGRREELAERLSRLDELSARARRVRRAAGPDRTGQEQTGQEQTGPEALEQEIARLRRSLGDPEIYHDQQYDRRAELGLLLFQAALRDEKAPALLDEAVTELTRARALLAGGRGGKHRVDILTKLAEAHVVRAARGGPHRDADRRAFVEVTREALGELAADVLLQAGADHGLSAALSGALLSRRLAFAAFLTRRPADAVADLEKGRALVLQTAAASRSVPELLDAAGHSGLARQWRAQVPARALADPQPAAGPPVPSALRRRALTALGVRPGVGEGPGVRRLVGAADAAGLTAGLAATGTDALVYLVPGMPLPSGSFPGHALILRPGAAPATLPLPELKDPGGPPLERYLDAAAERSRVLADPDADVSRPAGREERWQEALDTLCEWAWQAVMGPLLAAVRPTAPDGPARPPRIVLVPCGRLGAVPWHAARTRGPGEHGHRYACQEAVLGYAPSGAQFLAAAGRRRIPPAAGRQVLVADPELTLPWAEVETVALRTACYPGALRYGEFLTADGARDAAGTPEELLAVLPGGASPASVVHLSCHALAAPRPTGSALRLASPPGAGRDAGRLTVAAILDGAAGRRTDAAGPLVVLSACETDLSTRHHDEALTLATALVAGGAADVVGSRWAVRDGPTSVMMAVFHHHLTAGGLAPPDALRAAQMWMLDPHREPPPTLGGLLRREAARPDLHRLHHWAAFTHQGNPAPLPAS
ncbi:CHAT domain-containing protein [Streptomyces barkulensis]|uniref:CHAT domain-containing protein n=1 Tax=Streptomyces barkulensis TaxID=1257026 RepID=UPI000C6DBE7F|nr:CHAT domain-containing protein [Streptomyces barkulensis]